MKSEHIHESEDGRLKGYHVQEGISVNEIETRPRGGTKVSNYQVNTARGTPDHGVECSRPDLSIGGELVSTTADVEIERLERVVLGTRYFQEASSLI